MAPENETDIIKVTTSRFGDFEVSAGSVIDIIGGVIGFPGLSKFVLLEYNPPFSWLQSTENPELAFVVVNGAEFGDKYRFPIPYGDRDLDLKEDDEIAIVNLVSVRPDPSMTTVNLKAPVIVNLRTMIGRQVVLDDPSFPMRFPLWSGEQGGPGAEPAPEGAPKQAKEEKK
jgi:flagellar assembly factor FliW